MRGRRGEEKKRGEKALTEMIEIETLFIQTLLSTGTNQPRGRWERKRNPRQGMKLNVKGTGETQRSVRAAKSNERKRSGTPEGPKNWWLHLPLYLYRHACIQCALQRVMITLSWSRDRARGAKSTGRAATRFSTDWDDETSSRFDRDYFFGGEGNRGMLFCTSLWTREGE